MPKKIVPLVTGKTYHVYNRGVDKRIIFSDTADYLRFYGSLFHFNSVEPIVSYFECTKMLKKPPEHKLVDILSYCLIPNHFHLLLTQRVENGIAEFMKRICGGYANYFNEKLDRSGTLFQGKYKRVLVESDEKLIYLSSYINFNRTVHGIPETNEVFMTSQGSYTGKKIIPFVSTELILSGFQTPSHYEKQSVELTTEIHLSRTRAKDYAAKSETLE